MLATPTNFLRIPNNLSDVPNAASARANLGLGTAATANTGTANGNVPVISGGTIAASIVPTLNQNTTGTAANVTGTVAIGNGGTGAASAAAALTNLGALPIAGGTMAGTLALASNSLSLDGSSVIRANGGGTVTFTSVIDSFVASPPGISSGTSVAHTIIGTFSNSGTAAQTTLAIRAPAVANSGSGTTKIVDFQKNATTSLAFIDNLGVLHSNGAVGPSFSALQYFVVDGTNGSDSANGTEASPFATVGRALSVATAGMAVFIKPGTYTFSGTNSGLTPADGVAIIGAGRGVTIIQNHTDYNAVYRPGNNCLLKNITLDTADPSSAHHNGITVMLNTSGTTPTNVVFEDVDFICNYDGVNPGGNGQAGSSAGTFNWYFRNCHFHGACWMYYDQTVAGISSLFENCDWLGDGTITRADGNPQYAAVATASANSRITVVGSNITINDSTNNTNLWANAAIVASGAQVSLTGTNIAITCGGAASTAVVAPFAYFSGIGGGGTILLGDGVTFGSYSYYGNANLTLPTVQYVGATQSLAVASSAVTPFFNKQRQEFTVATDAAGLTSNTLLVNAPGNSASDGCRFSLRVKNTNAGSTAMTISLNGVYSAGGTSIGTIAAGKRAYFDFCFDADNSKWDLVGYTNGL